MLLRIVFVFALGGTNVAAELAGQINKKLPWSYLYTGKPLNSLVICLMRAD